MDASLNRRLGTRGEGCTPYRFYYVRRLIQRTQGCGIALSDGHYVSFVPWRYVSRVVPGKALHNKRPLTVAASAPPIPSLGAISTSQSEAARPFAKTLHHVFTETTREPASYPPSRRPISTMPPFRSSKPRRRVWTRWRSGWTLTCSASRGRIAPDLSPCRM